MRRLFLALLALPAPLAAGDITGRVQAVGFRDARNTVVYIEEIAGQTFSPPEKSPVMDQKNLTFVPHVLPVVAGTTVEFLNSDNVSHNVFSPSAIADKFNLGTYPKGASRRVKFDKAGDVVVLCNVHTEMSAYIPVLQNPFFAVTGAHGEFTIKGVPPGAYQLRLWHEKVKRRVASAVQVPSEGAVEVALELKR